MIKELIFAILLGGLLGFGLTGSFFGLKNVLITKPQPAKISTPTLAPQATNSGLPSPTTAPTTVPTINPDAVVITQPENESISTTETTTLTGTALPQSSIVIQMGTQFFTTKADLTGNFSLKIKLDSGHNLLVITAISPDSKQSQTTLEVTYSNARF